MLGSSWHPGVSHADISTGQVSSGPGRSLPGSEGVQPAVNGHEGAAVRAPP